jgi:hypothetical protein
MYHYPEKHRQEIKNSIPKIQENARIREIHELEPTIDEFRSVMEIIKSYLKKKKRIIYGGVALNLIHEKKIYSQNDFYDIEAYTPDPIHDIKVLCDSLYDKGYKYVICEEALHRNTFTINVNFLNYIDLTFVPSEAYRNIDVNAVGGFVIPKKRFLLIDMLRVFNDPMTSYWRLEKTVNRYFSLIDIRKKKSSFPKSQKLIIKNSLSSDNDILSVLDNIIKGSNFIIVGYLAHNIYKRSTGSSDNIFNTPCVEVISNDLSNDFIKIKNYLTRELGGKYKDIIFISRSSFLDLMGESFTVYIGSVKRLVVISNGKKCIPYNIVDSYLVGSFTYLLQYFLVSDFFHRVHSNKFESRNARILHDNMCVLKRNFYEKNTDKTPLTNTIFKEFVILCKGETMTLRRENKIRSNYRYQKKIMIRFRYEPSSKKGEDEIRRYYKLDVQIGRIFQKKRIKL